MYYCTSSKAFRGVNYSVIEKNVIVGIYFSLTFKHLQCHKSKYSIYCISLQIFFFYSHFLIIVTV